MRVYRWALNLKDALALDIGIVDNFQNFQRKESY